MAIKGRLNMPATHLHHSLAKAATNKKASPKTSELAHTMPKGLALRTATKPLQ
jgi:hypothetical protein